MKHIFAKRGSIACPLRGYIVACALSALSARATVEPCVAQRLQRLPLQRALITVERTRYDVLPLLPRPLKRV